MAMPAPMIRRRVQVAIGVLIALFGAWTLVFVLSAPTAATPLAQPVAAVDDACSGLVDPALTECNALVSFYTATQGDQWITATNWLSTTPGVSYCDWYGVTCAGGRVTQLNLGRNRLTGPLPPVLTNLTALTQLRLDGNRLRGRVNPSICAFAPTLVDVDLGYNALETSNTRVRTCLTQLDPDWAQTQTIAPRRVDIGAITTDTIELTWNPIAYTADTGGYEVAYATELTGTYTAHGHTANKNATGYTLDNLPTGETIFIQVRTATLAHAANPDMVRSESVLRMAVTRADEDMLLLVYGAFDNDLSEYAPDILNRLRLGTLINPNVRAVALMDRLGEDNSAVFVVANGQIQRTNAVPDRWGVGEVDTADPDVLAWFLTYARATYPATRTFVSIIGHGVGPAPEIAPSAETTPTLGAAALGSKVPPLPQGQDYTPGDVTSLNYMSTAELGRALAQATNNGADPFDLIFFDQCFQGNLDVLYEIRNAADVFVASPNYAWLSAPYTRYVFQMAPAHTTQAIADSFLSIYENSLDNTHPNAIFWISRQKIEALAAALDALALALNQATQNGDAPRVLSAAQDSRHADTTQCGEQRYTLAPPDELIGFGRFAINLRASFPAGDPAGVRAAAQDVIDILATVQRQSQIGNPYIAPDEFWDYDDALTILAPLRRDAASRLAWRASIYTQTAPITAVWAIDPSQVLTIPTALALAQDTHWDDFLAGWYTNQERPTVGQWCHYTPPARVLSADAEALTLTVSAEGDTNLRLDWTATDEESAEGYWLFARTPADLDWVLLTTLPLTETSSIQLDLLPGLDYRYSVFARDADGVYVARSNTITWTQPITQEMIYLPVIVAEE